jgi:hypothetical protein
VCAPRPPYGNPPAVDRATLPLRGCTRNCPVYRLQTPYQLRYSAMRSRSQFLKPLKRYLLPQPQVVLRHPHHRLPIPVLDGEERPPVLVVLVLPTPFPRRRGWSRRKWRGGKGGHQPQAAANPGAHVDSPSHRGRTPRRRRSETPSTPALSGWCPQRTCRQAICRNSTRTHRMAEELRRTAGRVWSPKGMPLGSAPAAPAAHPAHSAATAGIPAPALRSPHPPPPAADASSGGSHGINCCPLIRSSTCAVTTKRGCPQSTLIVSTTLMCAM